MTLIEVLVAMLIVSVLATASIAAFNGQRGKAQGAVAKTELRTAKATLAAYHAEHGTFSATAAQLVALEPPLADADVEIVGTETSYDLSVASEDGGRFGFKLDGGREVRTCTVPGRGGCAATPDADGNAW
jgi:prepilin-type N-terminal cleavage/methylation domain-containing protein